MSSPSVESRNLHKVRSLLAKAEATPFPEEAEAFTAKAHELMAKYAIEQVMLEGASVVGEPNTLTITMINPYPRAKFSLLSAVARTNRCQAVLQLSGDEKVATVVGFPGDLEMIELLYTSLLVQATTAMMAHGSVADAFGRSRTRSFRNAFLLGFASAVAQRFAANTRRAEQEASREHGRSPLPVLRDREVRVEDKLVELFPDVEKMGTSVSNGAGLAAGQRAGFQADLGSERLGADGRDNARELP